VIRKALLAVAFSAGLLGALPALPVAAAQSPATITIKTKTHGVGAHPILQWKRVPDAHRYLLSVNTTKGEPYWSWTGSTTKVRFGGGPLASPGRGATGAVLKHKMRWFVIAFDDAGNIVAVSKPRLIAP
jgi:hypothetical protein